MNWLLNCAKPFVISLILIFAFIKIAENSGTLEVEIDNYQELSDTSVKCIKLCVTTRYASDNCTLNTTIGNSEAKPGNVGDRVYTHPWRYKYNFNKWEDNSNISATVWKQPEDMNCDNSYPTTETLHGTGQHVIPCMKKPKKYRIVEDAQKWKLLVRTEIKCDDTNCLSPCMPRDDKTGHYTCIDGNKKCLENWFRTIENCTTFCNKSSTTYYCSPEGRKICLPNWYGEKCSTYCNESATTYYCSPEGQKICSTNLHKENCATKYEFEMKLNMTFTNELKDRKSEPFKKLYQETKQTVDDAYKNNPDYEDCNITDVRKGSVIVDITLIFRKPVPLEPVRTDAARVGKIGNIKAEVSSIRAVNESSTPSTQTTTEKPESSTPSTQTTNEKTALPKTETTIIKPEKREAKEPDQEWIWMVIGIATGMVLLLLTVVIIYKVRKNRSRTADLQITINQVAVYSKSEVEKSSREVTPQYQLKEQHINLGCKEDDDAVVKIK